MRTTINIDGEVLETAKAKARNRGLTLGKYIERALQSEATRPLAAIDDPVLPVHHGSVLPGIENMSNAELQEFLDRNLPLDKRR